MMTGNNRGVALVLVISVLTVVAIMAISFAFTMTLERKAALNYQNSVIAAYIAQAGIVHARNLLKLDKDDNSIDYYNEEWAATFAGSDVDNDDDGRTDSKWIDVTNDTGKVIGRYAVLVLDENSKVNVNYAGQYNEDEIEQLQGWSAYEINLKTLLSLLNISSAEDIVNSILSYRYGADGKPGFASKDDNNNKVIYENDNIDNDADGVIDESDEGIDEPDEFNLLNPYGDDKPFITTEGLKNIEGIDSDLFERIRNYVTVYSSDTNLTLGGAYRWNINSISAEEIVEVLKQAGVSNPWQKAVNIVDYIDKDNALSVIVKPSKILQAVSGVLNTGSWVWKYDHYEDETGTSSGSWYWSNIPVGEYYLAVYGDKKDSCIGDVSVGSRTQSKMFNGDIFIGTISVTDDLLPDDGYGSFSLRVTKNSEQELCSFKYIELSPLSGGLGVSSVEVKGVEAVRINEVMVKPVITLDATDADILLPGDWQLVSDHFENDVFEGGAGGETKWEWRDLPDGEYYLKVYGSSVGQCVGDVKINTVMQENMFYGDLYTDRETVSVYNGVLKLGIQNNKKDTTCFFKYIELLQQPDAEYIELVNISEKDIDIGGWTVTGPSNKGWPAAIPLGTTIEAGKYLVLAVDSKDDAPGINNNGISFTKVWDKWKVTDVVQLDFSNAIGPADDLIIDNPVSGENFITLKDNYGNIVDVKEYSSAIVQPYTAIEKGDPTYQEDTDGNGVDDFWYLSEDEQKATPGRKNNNDGIFEKVVDEQTEDEETIEHNLSEVNVKNNSLSSATELSDVCGGNKWQKIDIRELAKIIDKFSVYGIRLEAENHKLSGGGWSEKIRGQSYTSWFESNSYDSEAEWEWNADDRLYNGVYVMRIYGNSKEALSISVYLGNEEWSNYTPPLVPSTANSVSYGQIEIGTGSAISTPDRQLKIKVKNVSSSGTAHFDYIQLEPVPYIYGKININTADVNVLQCLYGIDKSTAEKIISSRPYGNKNGFNQGIGDLLDEDLLGQTDKDKIDKLKPIENLITVRSNIFEIIVTAQSLKNGRVLAESKIRTIVER